MRYLVGFIIVIATIVLVPVVAGALPSSFSQIYSRAAREGLSRPTEDVLLTEADLAHLPAPVQRYVRYSGAVGKPRVRDFHATMGGAMCREQGGAWTPITAEQYNFYDEPTRLFLMKSSLSGIPFDGLHVYRNGKRRPSRSSVRLKHALDDVPETPEALACAQVVREHVPIGLGH